MTILKKITSLLFLLLLILPGLGLFPTEAEAAFSGVITRGTVVSATGNSLFYAVSPGVAIAVGKIALITVVSDNQETTDGCITPTHQVTATDGHTWNSILQCTETDGAADDGVVVSFFWTVVTSQIGTADEVTVTFNAARSDIVISLIEVTSSLGNGIAVEQFTGAPASLSATLSSLTSSREYLFVGLAGSEGEDTAKDPDADYAELVDTISGTNGALANNLAAHVQYRIATLTGDTVTSAGWTNTNPIQTLTALYELPITAPTVTTGAASGITSATLSGNVTNTGGDDVDVRGFAWGTNSTLATVFATTSETAGGPFGTGPFNQFVSGLISGTTYYFRAYATNGVGTSFGTIESFVAGNDTTPSRKLRLFEGFTIKINEGGRLVVYQGGGAISLDDFYSESNQDAFINFNGSGVGVVAVAQAFTVSVGGTLDSAAFYLVKVGSPTGIIEARLYNLTQTYGTDAEPTGTALAASDDVTMESVTGSFQLITFHFSGANRIALSQDSQYGIAVFAVSGGDLSSNFLRAGTDSSSPAHDGNYASFNSGAWAGSNTDDMVFYVYVE